MLPTFVGMAIKYNIESVGDIMIPTSWKDVNFKTLCEFMDFLKQKNPNDYPLEHLSIRTGLSVDVLQRIPIQFVHDFDKLTSFFFDADTLISFNIYDPAMLVPADEKKGWKYFRYRFRKLLRIKQNIVSIPVMSWEQLAKAKQVIKSCADQNRHHMSAADEIFFIYCNERLNHLPVPAAYGLASFFLHKLMNLKISSSD